MNNTHLKTYNTCFMTLYMRGLWLPIKYRSFVVYIFRTKGKMAHISGDFEVTKVYTNTYSIKCLLWLTYSIIYTTFSICILIHAFIAFLCCNNIEDYFCHYWYIWDYHNVYIDNYPQSLNNLVSNYKCKFPKLRYITMINI